MKRIRRALIWLGLAILALLVAIASPILYVETACRSDAEVAQTYRPIIDDPAWQRPESRTFLTYPEWQIVYAYEEFAEILKDGDEYRYDYWRSIGGFWRSYCAMNREVDARGGVDWATRSTIYTIGASFDLELVFKAVYEETLGRLAAAIRGPEKTPQDKVAFRMAHDYAVFLHQTPWYKYPFAKEVSALWQAPVDDTIRGWERRLALGGEWSVKQRYANLIGQAVAATGNDRLRMRSVVRGLSPVALKAIAGVDLVGAAGENWIVETDRYAAFTDLAARLAAAGADFVEIAGNDEIMVSVLRPPGASSWPAGLGRVLAGIDRQGFDRRRTLVLMQVTQLAELFRQAPALGTAVEHIYDY